MPWSVTLIAMAPFSLTCPANLMMPPDGEYRTALVMRFTTALRSSSGQPCTDILAAISVCTVCVLTAMTRISSAIVLSMLERLMIFGGLGLLFVFQARKREQIVDKSLHAAGLLTHEMQVRSLKLQFGRSLFVNAVERHIRRKAREHGQRPF